MRYEDPIPHLDMLVLGSVAVSESGLRIGKGEGYADLEYAILRAKGIPPPRASPNVENNCGGGFFGAKFFLTQKVPNLEGLDPPSKTTAGAGGVATRYQVFF